MAALPQTEHLLAEMEGEWLTIWLNRPEARNALSSGMISELLSVLQAVRDDRSVRGITFRGMAACSARVATSRTSARSCKTRAWRR